MSLTPSADFNGYIHSVQVKGYAVIEYNFLNLPEKVTMGGDRYLSYYYDATGRKLTQELYNSDKTLLKRSDYTGEYFYENDTLKFINHEEGRVVMTGSEPEYQYHLKDHLGNVRMTFTTKDETENATATLETANLGQEQSEFLRYEHARRVQATLFDRTNGASPGYSQRLNGTANEKYGLARSISVMPGDVINAEVYAKYPDTESSNWTQALIDVMNAIAANTGGIVVDGGSYAISTSAFSYGGFVNTSGSSGTAPKAFLNWIVFDRDFNMLDGGFTQITAAAKETGTDIPHQRLFKDNINITKPGYVYIYLSNENETPVEVFFDDFKVVHTKSPVVQMDDYYPFGLTFNSYERENAIENQYLFTGKERQDELEIGWLDFGARMYQPEIARWNGVDASSENYVNQSPYHYAGNNPVIFVDYDGNDYGVSVNHNARTITIQAHFITNGANARAFNTQGRDKWNAQSGRNVFITGSIKDLKQGRAQAYSIEINVTSEVDNGPGANGRSAGDNRAAADQTGTVNSFDTVEEFPRNERQNGGTSNNEVTVKESEKNGGTTTPMLAQVFAAVRPTCARLVP